MGRDNWERNRIIKKKANSILARSTSPAKITGRKERHGYIQKMRNELVKSTNCDKDTAARHIGMASWHRAHNMKLSRFR